MKKLKYHFILSAGAVLFASAALTGCSTDDSFDGAPTAANSDKTEISFDTYVGRAGTRAAINDKNSMSYNSTGLGVFAMVTEGKKYDTSVTDGTTETVFTPNFMNNTNLTFFNYGYDANAKYAWRYTPLRYWPQDTTQYLSFTAYGPYKEGTQLYAKSGNNFTAGGDGASYYKHEVPADKAEQVDELYTDIKKTANMRYFIKNDSAWVKSGGTFLGDYPDEGEHGFGGPKVLLTMKHATSRIAIDMYCSELSSSISNGYKEQFKMNPTDGNYEYTNTRIIVNKVMLLGDSTSAESENPTGAFYSTGYLNLADTTAAAPRWVPVESDPKVACSWDNTGSKLETVRGEGYKLGHSRWIQGQDTDAPNIPGNEICGWRTSVSGNPYSYSGFGSGTEIGNDKDGYLFVIPQDFTGDTNKLFCYVDYTVRYADTGAEQHFKTYSRIKQNFEAGKAYRICIDFEISNPILFAVQFEDWPENEVTVETNN